MAQALNHTGAFATVTPIKKDMSEMVGNIEDNAFKYRAEARLEEQLAQKRKEAEIERKDKFQKDYLIESMKYVPSGIKTMDEYAVASLQMGMDQNIKDYNRARELDEKRYKSDLTPAENEEFLKLKVRQQNLQNLPENLANFMKSTKDATTEAYKGMMDGKYFKDDAFLDKMSNGLSSFIPSLDDNGLPQAGFAKFDRNNDGKIDNLDVITWDDINNGLAFKTMLQFDPEKEAMETAKNIGISESKLQQGYTTTETKGWNPENVDKAIDADFSDINKVISFARKLRPNDYQEVMKDPNKIEELKEQYKNMVLGYEDRKEISTTDLKSQEQVRHNKAVESQNAANEAGRNQRAKEANKVKLQTANKGKGVLNQKQSMDSLINYSKVKQEGTEGAPKGSLAYNMTDAAWNYSPADGINDQVTSAVVLPDKSLQLRITRYQQKTNGEQIGEPEDIVLNSKEQSNNIGNYLGLIENPKNKKPYSSVPQFVDALLKKRNANLGEEEKKKKTISGF